MHSMLGEFALKIKNCQFKQKFSAVTNSNMQSSLVVLTFSVFDQRYPFWANLVQKVKIVRLNWNLYQD